MKRLVLGLMGAVLVCAGPLGGSAQAGLFCGAGGYGCCPAPSCQPSCGCTSFKIERQTCYRTVYERVCHPETYTVNTTVSETVYDHHPETCYRCEYKPEYKDQQYTVCKPICETSYRTETYNTYHTVTETKYREC